MGLLEGESGEEGRGIVLVPIMIWEAAREMGVPEMDMPGFPGRRVVPSMVHPEGCGRDAAPVVMALAEEAGIGSCSAAELDSGLMDGFPVGSCIGEKVKPPIVMGLPASD